MLDNIIDIYNNDDGRYSKILHSDKTNVFNEWQDSLRFAALDCTELNYRINYDVEMFKKYVYDKSIDVNKNIVMTHTNELKIDPYAYDLRMNNYNCLFKSESPYSEDISV